ncbi:ABC transporter substrate-binding protein [Methyloligella sp. 2.7D]|uniref:ABC transporter substrate-binding protein n=1 Tax=unclassified Methyloligella TaxID=2625955 RepID=UPI00157D5B80|nr:ABC transporter substrate-binding protein [Methyloligella sp. GL2]QKP77904.1 ABC transporter substrate-binding protein [Methyloligella sp. GL2]
MGFLTRLLLLTSLVLAVTAAGLLAPGQSFGVSPAIAAGGKTLRMAYDADPVSLDPHEQLSGATLQMSHLLFDPLLRFDTEMKLQPRLATRWEQIDERTTRFYLRPGVKFHSGRELTANDVVWTLNRLKRSPDFKALFEPFEGARVIDNLTVDLITKKPYPLVLNLATYIFPMDQAFYSGEDERGEAKDAIVKHGASFASTHVSGTGPFMVVKREQGVKLVLKRFDDYWDKQSPGNVQRIVFTPIREPATRVAALLAGDVDFIAPVPPGDLDRLRAADCCDLITMESTRILTFELNQDRVPAFKDKRVRLAVNYAINREGIVAKIMRGFATPAGQLSPDGYAGHDPALTPRYDLAKAKDLMREAGYEDGFSITMIAPNNRYAGDYRIAQAVAAMLAKINIKVDLQAMPKAQYWQRFDAREGDMLMIGWQSDTQDSANLFEFLAMTPDPKTGYGQYNAGDYSNPEVDKLTLESQTVIDSEARAELLQRVEHILYDDGAMVPLQWQHLSWGARKGVDIGAVLNQLGMPYLGDLVIE